MICPKCEAVMPDGDSFCPKCGSTLDTGDTPEQAESPGASACCRKCGRPVNPGDSFCGGCGTALAAAQAPVPLAESAPPPAPEQVQKRSKVSFIIAIAAAVLLLGGGAGWYFLAQHQSGGPAMEIEEILEAAPETPRPGPEPEPETDAGGLPPGGEEEDILRESDEQSLVWRIEPVLDYDRIYSCGWANVFTTGEHEGYVIDTTTGRRRHEYSYFGHGGYLSESYYDAERSLYGYYSSSHGEESFRSLTRSELENELSGFSVRMHAFRRIDISRVRTVTDEYGSPYYDFSDALMGDQYAFSYGADFVTDFIYDYGPYAMCYSGLPEAVAAALNGKQGIIDKRGNVVAPFIFEHILFIDDYAAFAKLNGRYGILDVRKTAQSAGIFGYSIGDFAQENIIHDASAILLRYYMSYLTAINNQNMQYLRYVTPAQAERLRERVFGVNSDDIFWLDDIIIDLSTVRIYEQNGRMNLSFYASFAFTYQNRSGGGRIEHGENIQQVGMAFDEDKLGWLVDNSEIVRNVTIGNNRLVLR